MLNPKSVRNLGIKGGNPQKKRDIFIKITMHLCFKIKNTVKG
jgi:hypothetical protein